MYSIEQLEEMSKARNAPKPEEKKEEPATTVSMPKEKADALELLHKTLNGGESYDEAQTRLKAEADKRAKDEAEARKKLEEKT